MAILDDLRRERGLAMLFITHDLELAGAVCDRTCVMYAGSIVEQQSSAGLNTDPLHSYTAALLAARPRLDATAERLAAIVGRPARHSRRPRDARSPTAAPTVSGSARRSSRCCGRWGRPSCAAAAPKRCTPSCAR